MNTTQMLMTLACFSLVALFGCSHPSRRSSTEPLPVVDRVDLKRYQGKWFEIARFDNPFQKNCAGTTATYGEGKPGYITVKNECWRGGFSGMKKTVKGKAKVVDQTTNAKLQVRFSFFPANLFPGQYWIIGLDQKNYQYAVVSEPKGRYLWILSRTPQMEPALLEKIKNRLTELDFDVAQLMFTEQKNEG